MPDTQPPPDSNLRSRLARTLTTGALCFLVIVAVVALIGAAIYSVKGPLPPAGQEDKRAAVFFDMAKYILATVLPVVAGWVGTVLAFYYGKENFEAGTKSMTDAAKALTSKEKLAATVIANLGKARTQLKAFVLDDTQSKNPRTIDLETIKNQFRDATTADKLFERLPVLLPADLPYMVLHRSTLNAFLVESGKAPKDSTLGELFDKVDYLPKDSVVIVGPAATAAQAKTEMEKVPNCSDVFVTADGTTKTAVIRWITNVDLLQAAEV